MDRHEVIGIINAFAWALHDTKGITPSALERYGLGCFDLGCVDSRMQPPVKAQEYVPGSNVALALEEIEKLLDTIATDEYIVAIKAIRAVTGADLRGAKEVADKHRHLWKRPA